jgi:hypothetical protein
MNLLQKLCGTSRKARPVPGKPARRAPAKRPGFRPTLEALEDRVLCSVGIYFDYSRDTNHFFVGHPDRIALLNQAATTITSRLTDTSPAVTVSTDLQDPAAAQGTTFHVNDLSVPAGQLVVYVGGTTTFDANHVGEGYWNAFNGSLPWGGVVQFNMNTNWYFGFAPINHNYNSQQVDFLTMAEHELGHVLGIGSFPGWTQWLHGNLFFGPAAMAEYGMPVPADTGHFNQNVLDHGAPVTMKPTTPAGVRNEFTALDYAALQDVGWHVAPVPIAEDFTRLNNTFYFTYGPPWQTLTIVTESAPATQRTFTGYFWDGATGTDLQVWGTFTSVGAYFGHVTFDGVGWGGQGEEIMHFDGAFYGGAFSAIINGSLLSYNFNPSWGITRYSFLPDAYGDNFPNWGW